ncbi:MAG: PQQ-dependent sugar dehydrogenase, partial [Acidobacteriota bacterium]
MRIFMKTLTALVVLVVTIFLIHLIVPRGVSEAQSDRSDPKSDGYVQHLVAKNLDRPEAVVPLANNAVLVAERSGRILLLKGDSRTDLGRITVPDTPIFYVPDHPYTEGLKDLISVPGQPDVFLWSMTTGTAQARRWTIGRAKIKLDQKPPPAMENTILWQSELQPWTRGSVPPFSGCRLVVQGDDVVVAMGGNSRETGIGKIMRISLSGSHAPELISTGHRNPSGVVFASGTLWEVEHGPKGGDELNIIVQGGDYGWAAVSKGEPDDAFHPKGFLKSRPGSIDPVVTWSPAIAPSSITSWRGKLYVGALAGQSVL